MPEGERRPNKGDSNWEIGKPRSMVSRVQGAPPHVKEFYRSWEPDLKRPGIVNRTFTIHRGEDVEVIFGEPRPLRP